MIRVPEYVQKLKPYKPGNALKKTDGMPKIEKFINLASNENPLGPSPKAVQALHDSAKYMSLYPDALAQELVAYLSATMNRKPEQIICGSGTDSLIADIIKAFSDFNDEIIIGAGTFVGYFVHIQKLGRKTVLVPLIDYALDLEAMLAAITPRTRIIFLPNPNNPTGMMINKQDLEAFLTRVPDDVLVVLDEAYFIFSQVIDDFPNGLDYNLPNLIVLRTLSKSHGLAGIRIGFAIGPEELIGTLYKVKLPFEPNIIAQKIAKAALEDQQFVFETIKLNTITINMFRKEFDRIGLKYPFSAGNFLMVVFENEIKARQFTDECYNRGILVRHLPPFGIPNCVRISTGLIYDTKHAIEVFEEIVNI